MKIFTKEQATLFFADYFWGEHHIPSEVKQYGQGWFIYTQAGFSTVDYSNLTRLVIMAHARAIRVEIKPHNTGRLKVCIWQRKRQGTFDEKHPTILSAIKTIHQTDVDWAAKNNHVSEKGIMQISEINNVLNAIRQFPDLDFFQSEMASAVVEKYNISFMQVNFLVSVVAAERIKEKSTIY